MQVAVAGRGRTLDGDGRSTRAAAQTSEADLRAEVRSCSSAPDHGQTGSIGDDEASSDDIGYDDSVTWEPWQLFASLGILLALAEFFTPTFFALPAGLAFLMTAFVALFTQNWQILAFDLALNLALVYLTFQRFVWPRLQKSNTKTNVAAMIGKRALVTEAVDPETGAGEVKLYGDTWKVISHRPFSVGTHVRITNTEGNRVVIDAE